MWHESQNMAHSQIQSLFNGLSTQKLASGPIPQTAFGFALGLGPGTALRFFSSIPVGQRVLEIICSNGNLGLDPGYGTVNLILPL